MNRLIRALVSITAVFFLLVVPGVGAVDLFEQACRDNPMAEACRSNQETANPGGGGIYGPNGILATVTQIIIIIIGIAAVIMIIIGGLQYVLSTGDPAKINTAKNTVIYAIVGLVIAVIGQAIISLVVRSL